MARNKEDGGGAEMNPRNEDESWFLRANVGTNYYHFSNSPSSLVTIRFFLNFPGKSNPKFETSVNKSSLPLPKTHLFFFVLPLRKVLSFLQLASNYHHFFGPGQLGKQRKVV